MQFTPKIALFEPEEPLTALSTRLFTRNQYSIRLVSYPADILALLKDGESPFDAAIIWPRLKDGQSGINSCLQMKSLDELAAIPILVLSQSKDKAILEAFYGAGADIVVCEPFDAQLLSLQIGAISRLKRSYNEQLRIAYETAGLRSSLVNAFDSVREGMIIATARFEPIVANHAVYRMLGVSNGDMDSMNRLFEQFIPIAENFDKKNQQSQLPIFLTRKDGRKLESTLRLTRILGQGGLLIGYAFSITDRTELEQLSSKLLQAGRTSSLSLLCAATCRSLLNTSTLGPPTAPLDLLSKTLARESLGASLSATVTFLLELLDTVLDHKTEIKVSVSSSAQVMIKPSDVFLIMGEMLLSAIDFAGSAGEISLTTEDPGDQPEIYLCISAISGRITEPDSSDRLAQILRGDLSSDLSSHSSHISFGIRAAQARCDRYGCDIEMKRSGSSTLKLRVALPLLK